MKHMLRLICLLLACLLFGGTFVACGKNEPEKPDSAESETTPASESETKSESETATSSGTQPEILPESEDETVSETETTAASETAERETDAESTPETAPETDIETLPVETSLGLANVALECPVITNNCDGGTNQNLTDGNSDTNYSTTISRDKEDATFPYEVVIDLTKAYPVKGLNIHKFTGKGAALKNAFYREFKVEVSIDGFTYTEVATHANASDIETGLTVAMDAEARFVRIISTNLGSRNICAIALSEIEVLSDVTNYDNILPNKRALSMQPTATDTLTATYRISGSGEFRFYSEDPTIVSIDETTGALVAHINGETRLYITDGENVTYIPVTVWTRQPEYRVATFYLANHGENSREVFALLKESGITYLENCRPFDSYGNDTTQYLLVQANDFGLTLSVADPLFSDYLNMTDEEIRAVVRKYKNRPGFGGMYILDEPYNANPYARVYKAMLAEDPFCQPHLNLLPGSMPDFHGYVSDWVATVGGNLLKSLSYDNYPFGVAPNSFNTGVYGTMNELRQTALMYGVNTGYYVHSMGIHNAYRVPTDSEILYHCALGVAYGYKDYKHFVWFTPPYSGSGEHFITGILNSEYGKSEIFEGVKNANTMLHTLSPILGNSDSVEVYHTRGRDGGVALPTDFCITQENQNRPIVLSILVDRTTGQQYIVVVNKAMNADTEINMVINDAALSELWDMTSGEGSPMKIENGKFTLALPAGGLAVIKLPEGYDARAYKNINDGTVQSLLMGVGASVSSSVGDGTFAYKLNDGNRLGSGWANNHPTDETAWISFDLKAEKTFDRVDIYPMEGQYALFPKDLTVWVSTDGVEYTKVSEHKDIRIPSWGSITFDAVTARYIKITIDRMVNIGSPTAIIGEIEVYHDLGAVPAMPAFKVAEREPAANGNLILNAPFVVSSSYEMYGWTKNVINDGRTTYQEGVHQGWTTQIGSQVPECNEWVAFILDQPATIKKMVIYPVSTFVADYHVEVSLDGVTWTTVASVTGEDYMQNGPRTLEFDPTEACFVRLVITKMGEKSSMAAVGYKASIMEIEVF